MTNQTKADLRRIYQQRRDALADRAARSAVICTRVAALPLFQQARAVHCYLPMRSEVDPRPLLLQALAGGKRLVVPIVRPGAVELAHSWLASLEPHDLQPGPFGTFTPRILAPAAIGAWDLTLTPLLAFDRAGYRLGYGKGFYDRLIAAAGVPAVGLAFAAQAAEQLPREPHDVPLDYVVTEAEVLQLAR